MTVKKFARPKSEPFCLRVLEKVIDLLNAPVLFLAKEKRSKLV
jgi:hypothetical protein